jgi:hypothetical protein
VQIFSQGPTSPQTHLFIKPSLVQAFFKGIFCHNWLISNELKVRPKILDQTQDKLIPKLTDNSKLEVTSSSLQFPYKNKFEDSSHQTH